MENALEEIVERVEKRLDKIEDSLNELQKNFYFQKGKVWAYIVLISAGISGLVQFLLAKIVR